jgi:oligopeptide transport system permease protein
MSELSKEKFNIIGCENADSNEIVRPNITYWQDAWRRLKKNKAATFSMYLLLVISVLAIVAPFMRPQFGINGVDQASMNLNSNGTHWFGTDNLGRDLWVRVWYGTRVSVLIGIAGAAMELIVGVIYGAAAGYFGGKTDNIMMRIIEILNSIPYLIQVLLIVLILGNKGIAPLIIAMGITGWVGMARLVRGQVLTLKEREFVLAAKALGGDSKRIIFKHLLPNTVGVMIVDVTFAVPGYIFAEAFLSFIGLGVQSPNTSLGALCSSATSNLMFYPFQLFWPSLIISLIMLAFNLFGDGLNDALDPKQRQ